ncbi:metal-dependent hydrolase [Fictibacillus sp. WQ 8-8]|uniref:metal-dependent hydrolase n=1 Tax=unclassified Fictibacillus TaxID=2644029 RepID=UPI002109953A|nr:MULTISPECIES: metal-dependent hydrolase [unclassified Fictibacillus]MCQ6266568.1 metal-dependent hydrolase [Fictibacillus sp. WQ 8-8]UZJ80302.1 metal-dependent hydrolase [Fictibacillus sp. KU28468]
MKLTFHGQSAVEIQTEKHSIWIDPFIKGNDTAVVDIEDVKPDVILLTHGHNDHAGDAEEIARKNNSLIVAPFELAEYFGTKGLNVHPMHIGGGHQFEWGHVKWTQAFHGSSFTEEDGTVVYTGMPAGILFTAEGKTIYHAGDTALFSDMKLIGERNNVDVAFLPIGDNFTMGPEDAATAAEWVNAKLTVPIHYNTFPLIEQDADQFVSSLKVEGKVLKPGESIER